MPAAMEVRCTSTTREMLCRSTVKITEQQIRLCMFRMMIIHIAGNSGTTERFTETACCGVCNMTTQTEILHTVRDVLPPSEPAFKILLSVMMREQQPQPAIT